MSLTYNLVDAAIVQELQQLGLYDTFIQQIQRIAPTSRQVFVFQHTQPGRLCYYIYHQGFLLESDNGFSAIVITHPENCPELVKAVKAYLAAKFDSPIRVLWTDHPQQRN